MVNAYVGNPYKLVFPLLCNGYLNIDYEGSINHPTDAKESSGVLVNGAVGNGSSTNIAVDTVDATTKFSIGDNVYDSSNALVGTVSAVTATQITLSANNAQALDNNENLKKNITPTSTLRDRSIWAHDGSFTLEAIFTPYDVNGTANRTHFTDDYGGAVATDREKEGRLDSQKSPPYPSDLYSNRDTVYESVSILGTSAYLTQKMMLFNNPNLKLYLQNTTSSSYNQPAEYKVVAEIKDANAQTLTVSSPTVIKSNYTLNAFYDETGFYNQHTTSLQQITSSGSSAGGNKQSTITVTSNTLPSNVAAVNATGSVTIANRNGLNTDVFPVAESTIIKFGNQPVASDTTNVNNYIQIVSEDGGTTTKWFARSTGTNGAALNGTSSGGFSWPTGARQYNIGGDIESTATNFAQAVNGFNEGFAGSASSPADGNSPFVGGNTTEDITLTVALTGTTPNRKGNDSASLTFGTTFSAINTDGNGNTIGGANFSGGANELVQGESTGSADTDINYISITDSAGTTKNYFPSHDSSQATGSTGTRTLDNGSTVSVVYFNFASGGSNNDAATALKNAINHANGHPSTITATRTNAVVNLSHDLIGTTGNSATLAKTNTADSVATISGSNFTGGVNASTTNKHVSITDDHGTTKLYHAADAGQEAQSSSDGTYTYFRNAGDNNATAENLKLAIESAQGHNGELSVSRADNVLTVVTGSTTGSPASSENYDSGLTVSAWTTGALNKLNVGSTAHNVADKTVNLGAGAKIYNALGNEIGTVASTTATQITLTQDLSVLTNLNILYTEQPREAMYLEEIFKVTLVFLAGGTVELYLDNGLIQKQNHTLGTVSLDKSDCKIGRGANNAEQYYGELFEMLYS